LDETPRETIEELLKYPNVVGVSRRLRNKIVGGRETPLPSIRVYVSRKMPVRELKPSHVVPKVVADIPTDVVEIGEIKALGLTPKNPSKLQRVRPVVFGVSIGNAAVTAGTNGWLYKQGSKEYFGSNAHVFTPNASMKPSQVEPLEILQPGPYDKGGENDVVALYAWHERVKPMHDESECSVSRFIAGALNAVYKALGRKTRFKPIVPLAFNHVDFALAEPTVEYEAKIIDMDTAGKKLVGHIFGGSDKAGVFFKLKYVLEKGITPVGVEYDNGDLPVGAVVEKSGRTTCHSSAKVIDDSVVLTVNYIDFLAVFEDVVLTENPGGSFVQGGDSGSAVWLQAS